MSVDSISNESYPLTEYDDEDEMYSSGIDDVIDFDEISNEEHTSRQPWEIITPTNIRTHQEELMTEVAELLACPRVSARVLLIGYRWNKERIMSKHRTQSLFLCYLVGDFVEKGKNHVFHRVGCSLPDSSTGATSDFVDCECCLMTVDASLCTVMSCGHCFCNDCWMSHFSVQINDGNSCQLRCMAFRCNYICDENKVNPSPSIPVHDSVALKVLEMLNGYPKAQARYQRSLEESYINDNMNVKWCPSVPHCGNAIKVNGNECCEPLCNCGMKFCFTCLSNAHSPCTCDMWTAWEKKRKDESETLKWITANTKPCPKCGNSVEKNGGCNLMTCRCGQHFCWLCGDKTGVEHTYRSIANHQCGRWKEEMEKNIKTAAADHRRYMHYYTRWKQHMDSLSKEIENRAKSQEIFSSPASPSSSEDSMNLILQNYCSVGPALDLLVEARRVLANSYPFAFFMCGNDWFADKISPSQNSLNQQVFEDLQQQFENEVENLSKLLYEESEDLDLEERQTMVINSSRSINRRMRNLYHAIDVDLLGQQVQSACYIADFVPNGFHI
eukprot:g2915.t1